MVISEPVELVVIGCHIGLLCSNCFPILGYTISSDPFVNGVYLMADGGNRDPSLLALVPMPTSVQSHSAPVTPALDDGNQSQSSVNHTSMAQGRHGASAVPAIFQTKCSVKSCQVMVLRHPSKNHA